MNKLFRKKLMLLTMSVILLTATASYASWFTADKASDDGNAPFTFNTFRTIAKECSPAVVNIATTTIVKQKKRFHQGFHGSPFGGPFGDDFFRQFFGQPNRDQKVRSLGSGVIIDTSGYIITNWHVVEDVDEIQVKTLDGKEYDAEIVGRDRQTDIALLKIEPEADLHALPMGNSEFLQVGDWVMAIGNPFGFGHTVTVGVVSAKGRSGVMSPEELPYQNFIQTDASINPGNSGGPLINIHGELVGINAVIASRTGQSAGIGFAIPVNMIVPIINQLKDKGTVTRGWLGVTIQPLTPDLAQTLGLDSTDGALVSEVLEDGPAEKGGVKVQDVIVEFNGKKVKDSGQLSRIVAATEVNKKVRVVVMRDGKQKVLRVKLGERPDNPGEFKSETGKILKLGMNVQNITKDIANQLNLDSTEGVLISEVEPGGAADRAGLVRGDVILEFNQQKIKNVATYREAVRKLEPGEGAVLYIRRGDSKIFVAIKTPK